jgi:hypothetical protein
LAAVLGTAFLVVFAVLPLVTLLTVLFLVVLDFAVANFNLLNRDAGIAGYVLARARQCPEPEKRVSVL